MEKREIENYFCSEAVLFAYAGSNLDDDLFGRAERQRRIQAMKESVQEISSALEKLGRPSPWSPEDQSHR